MYKTVKLKLTQTHRKGFHMITFTLDLLTNVKTIDGQHKELINRINAVTSMGSKSAGKEETEKTLDMLGAYVVKHFNDEEALQILYGYPKYDIHHAQHQHFLSEYRKLKTEYTLNGPSVQFSLRLSKSIIDWITRHIKSSDSELGIYINQNK
jgi:hemerythrin